MATAERHAGREVVVPADPTPDQYAGLAQREKQLRKDNKIPEDELSVLLDEKGPFGLFSISVGTKGKDGRNVRNTDVTPLYLWLPLQGTATAVDVVAFYANRYPGQGDDVLVQRARSAETVFRRSQQRLKGGAGRGRGRKFRSAKLAKSA